MAKFEVIMPKMGESIIEATIIKWLKSEGDSIEEEDVIVEIATDKVDSEIPSPVDGKLVKRLFKEGDTVEVGKVIAIIATEGEEVDIPVITDEKPVEDSKDVPEKTIEGEGFVMHHEEESVETYSDSDRFYSPLVKSIAKEENISVKELDNIKGSGRDGRVTKKDILIYIDQKKSGSIPSTGKELAIDNERLPVVAGSSDEIMEMDRLRKLIADHMVMSVRTSAHVTSFIEVDMTNIVKWRDKIKDNFLKKENEKITFTHIFVEAIAKTVRDYPMVNVSVDGYKIIKRKNINIGMAVALPSGNLIVPVVKKADQLNLRGIVKRVNDLADRARSNKLAPDEIQDGTITLTNLGSFGTVMGTPIINQPQVAIVAVGSIKKRPVVLETADGDVIGIRQIMYLSLTYDHRVIDGALGGTFINKMKQYLENFDVNQGV
ncbi:dihydrolipoamide acetyltransferase family protein [Bacteroidota bacterium]